VLDTLPKFLRMDIAKHNNSGIIHEVPLFSTCDDHFCRELALQLKPEFFLPGVDIVMEGEMGNEMFFQSRECKHALSKIAACHRGCLKIRTSHMHLAYM
jgi:hypothetical protein